MKCRIENDVDSAYHIDEDSGCWLWDRCLVRGYGQLKANGKRIYAHRFMFEMLIGPVPAGKKVLHRCDVPRCVNPAHLFLGTQADNMADCARKGRQHSKITTLHVQCILRDCRPQKTIAKEYGLDQSQISRIKNRVDWRHV